MSPRRQATPELSGAAEAAESGTAGTVAAPAGPGDSTAPRTQDGKTQGQAVEPLGSDTARIATPPQPPDATPPKDAAAKGSRRGRLPVRARSMRAAARAPRPDDAASQQRVAPPLPVRVPASQRGPGQAGPAPGPPWERAVPADEPPGERQVQDSAPPAQPTAFGPVGEVAAPPPADEAAAESAEPPSLAELDAPAEAEAGVSLSARLMALARMIQIGHARSGRDGFSEKLLADAEDVLARAGERMRLSSSHTVVVLAGGTGSGKSSLFNCVAGAD